MIDFITLRKSILKLVPQCHFCSNPARYRVQWADRVSNTCEAHKQNSRDLYDNDIVDDQLKFVFMEYSYWKTLPQILDTIETEIKSYENLPQSQLENAFMEGWDACDQRYVQNGGILYKATIKAGDWHHSATYRMHHASEEWANEDPR